MKNVLLLLLALLAFSVIPAKAAVADAVLEYYVDTTITEGNVFDSLVTASDSTLICAATARFKTGWTYYLQLGRLAGASKDTCNLTVAVDAYAGSDTLIGRSWGSDTSIDRSETVMLNIPIGAGKTSAVGVKYKIYLKNVSVGGTAAAKLNFSAIKVIKARPMNYNDNTR